MPLLGFLLLNAALGLMAARAAARELRASPRPVMWSQGFGVMALHEVLVAAPVGAYVLARFTDWAFSYVVDGARVPSVALGLGVVAFVAVGLMGYVVGAHWLRAHHGQRALVGAGVLLGLALLGALVAHRRLGLVGTTTEYRGGFGLLPFGASRASGACGMLGTVEAAAVAHLFWTLQSLGPGER